VRKKIVWDRLRIHVDRNLVNSRVPPIRPFWILPPRTEQCEFGERFFVQIVVQKVTGLGDAEEDVAVLNLRAAATERPQR
jgi:hypothetical protein